MRKGLRRAARLSVIAGRAGVNRSPDEKGITTTKSYSISTTTGVNRSPDEKGITT